VIVIDASAMIELLLDTEVGREVGDRVFPDGSRHAPHLLDIEVAQVLRRFVSANQLKVARGREALVDLSEFPLTRHAHTLLLERVFELRHNLSAYDAAYVALAEALGATLLTCDRALARAPHLRAKVELLG
jgi:predicted nucleic acid-binding protein